MTTDGVSEGIRAGHNSYAGASWFSFGLVLCLLAGLLLLEPPGAKQRKDSHQGTPLHTLALGMCPLFSRPIALLLSTREARQIIVESIESA
jgi:hypothetical protein